MKQFIIILLILCMLPIVFGVTANNFLINLTGSNTTVNVTSSWTYSQLTVDNTSFTVYNLTHEGSIEPITLNLSAVDKRYVGSDIPYFSSSTETTKVITSNVRTITGASALINSFGCASRRYTYTTSNGSVNSEVEGGDCPSGVMSISLSKIETGQNTISISQYVGGTSNIILQGGLAVMVALIVLIFLGYPIFSGKYEEYTIKEWMIYFVVSIVALFLMIILLNNIFSIT